jgi:uncharacterized protein
MSPISRLIPSWGRAVSFSGLLVLGATFAHADWFVSTEIKAESGDVNAQFRVANAYDSGRGAPRNREEATRWYTLAANQGHPQAQNSLGSVYQERKEFTEAILWYQKAAEQNLPIALNNLGYMHDLGLGVPQSRKKAFEHYLRAANLGWSESMWNLTIMYASAQIGEKDMYSACIWANRAVKTAKPYQTRLRVIASNAVLDIEAALSEDQKNACRKQYEDWTPEVLLQTPSTNQSAQ